MQHVSRHRPRLWQYISVSPPSVQPAIRLHHREICQPDQEQLRNLYTPRRQYILPRSPFRFQVHSLSLAIPIVFFTRPQMNMGVRPTSSLFFFFFFLDEPRDWFYARNSSVWYLGLNTLHGGDPGWDRRLVSALSMFTFFFVPSFFASASAHLADTFQSIESDRSQWTPKTRATFLSRLSIRMASRDFQVRLQLRLVPSGIWGVGPLGNKESAPLRYLL
jgi:hypothetical protein